MELTKCEFLQKLDDGELPTVIEGRLYEQATRMRGEGLLDFNIHEGWSIMPKGHELLNRAR